MSDRLIGRRMIRLDAVGSTMDEIARLAANGEPEGTVVVAEEQSAGRGRAGRVWAAPRGMSILCSILLRPAVAPARLPILSLIAGAAVAELLELSAAVDCRLKWPNDVWIDGRKVAGILVTARSGPVAVEHAIVGIGINVNVPASQLPAGATSLLDCTGQRHDRSGLLDRLLARFETDYRAFASADVASRLSAWHARAALVGEAVAVESNGERREGVMRGVDDDGALLLERPDGRIERIVAGDLTRGPVRTI